MFENVVMSSHIDTSFRWKYTLNKSNDYCLKCYSLAFQQYKFSAFWYKLLVRKVMFELRRNREEL